MCKKPDIYSTMSTYVVVQQAPFVCRYSGYFWDSVSCKTFNSSAFKQVSWRFLNSFYNIFSLPYIVPVYHRAICRPLDRPEKRPRAEIRAWDERHGKMPIVAELVSPGWNSFEFVFCKYIIFWFKRISVNPLTIEIVVK